MATNTHAPSQGRLAKPQGSAGPWRDAFGRLLQEQAGDRRPRPRHPAAVRRDLRAVPRAVAVPGAGPQGGPRQRRPAAAAVVAGPHPRDRPARPRPAQPAARRRPDQRHRRVRRPDRHHLHRRADRRDRRLVRRPRRTTCLMRFTDVIYAFPDLLFIILLSVAFRETVVRPGARRPAARLRRHRPHLVGDGRPARPRPDAVAQGDRVRRGGQGDRRLATATSSRATCCPTGWARSSSRSRSASRRAILAEATLAYIGIGVQPPRASWGSLIAEGQKYIRVGAAPRALPGHLHRPRADRLHLPRRRPARRARSRSSRESNRWSSAEEDVSAADAPTIVELSADDVLRARADAVANAGIGRKADAPARGPRPVDPLLHAGRRRPGRRRRQLRRRLRRDARAGRRVGLRQERHGAVDRAARRRTRPGKIVAGADPVRRDRRPQAQRRGHAQAARQGDRVHLPGPADQPQPDADDRLPDRRGDPRAPGPVAEGGRGPDRRAAGARSASRGPRTG